MKHYKISLNTLITAALCIAMVVYAYQFYMQGGIIRGHVKYARIVNLGIIFIHPAFGIFWLASAFHYVTSVSILESLYVLLGVHFALTLCAIIWVLKLLTPNPMNAYGVLFLALALMVVSPIGLPFLDPQIYNFLFMNRSTLLLRNATHTALLPYAIIAFGLLADTIRHQITVGAFSKKNAILAGVFLALSSIVKPSFAISIIPGIIVYLLFKRNIAWSSKLRIICILLPTCCLVCGQIYISLYNPYRNTPPMELLPWATWTENNIYPIPALVLAIVFPIFIGIFRFRSLASFTIIAWLNLGIAIIPYILFTCGERDLEWPYLHAKIILFICSVVEWNKWRVDKQTRQISAFSVKFNTAHIVGVLFILHTLFGIVRLLFVDTL